VPTLAAALEREPAIANNARVVGMYGSVRRGYEGSPQIAAEYNVKLHTPDCQKVFTAPWELSITPLDTCGLVRLSGEKFKAIQASGDKLVQAMMENYRIWLRSTGKSDAPTASTVLYDTVAVYMAFSEELLKMERLGIRVTDDGFTLIDPAAKQVNCATQWRDLAAFEDFLVQRLTQ
jgi:inosine-uridine nucleoside N-ribohydrolase